MQLTAFTSSLPCFPLAALLLTSCSGSGGDESGVTPSGNAIPKVVVLSPDQPVQVSVGDELQIEFVDEDPDSNAVSLVVAVPFDSSESTKAETVPEIVLAEVAENDGATQTVLWDTTGVLAADYVVEIRTSDEESTTTASSAVIDLIPAEAEMSDIQVFEGALSSFRLAGMPDGSMAMVGLYSGDVFLEPDSDGSSPTLSTVGDDEELAVAVFWPDKSLRWVRTTRSLAAGAGTGLQPDRLDLAVSSNGRVVVGLTFDEPFELQAGPVSLFTCSPASFGSSACVFALDDEGKLLWTRGIEGAPSARICGLEATGDGGVLIAGSTDGQVALSSGSGSSLDLSISGQLGGFVARLDPAGDPVWLRRTELGNVAEAIDVALGSNGVYAILGSFDGAVQFGETGSILFADSGAAGASAYCTIFSASGSVLNAIVLSGSNGASVPLDLMQIDGQFVFLTRADGAVEVTAPTDSVETKPFTNTALYLTWVDSDGEYDWTRLVLHGDGVDSPTNLLGKLDETYVVVAAEIRVASTPETWTGDAFEPTDGPDSFVGLYDSSSELLAAHQDGGNGTLRVRCIGQLADEQPFLGVRSEGPSTVGLDTDEPSPISDQAAVVPIPPFQL